MSRAVHIEGVMYLPAVDAGKLFGYTNDYIARLAREQKVLAKRIGHQWFVDPESVSAFAAEAASRKQERAEELRRIRKQERLSNTATTMVTARDIPAVSNPEIAYVRTTPDFASDLGVLKKDGSYRMSAILQSGCVVGAGVVLGALLFLVGNGQGFPTYAEIARTVPLKEVAYTIYHRGQSAGGPSGGQLAAVAGGIGETEEEVSDDFLEGNQDDAKTGVVLFDEGVYDEASLRDSFSDEVSIEIDVDGRGGILRPIFRSPTDESYRFLMVPIQPRE